MITKIMINSQKMYIVMELCLGGELSDELKRRTSFKEAVRLSIIDMQHTFIHGACANSHLI